MNPTETKMRPILFSTEMVQAILAGRKTQTRRVVKFPKTALINLLPDEEITLTRMQDGYKDGIRPVWGSDDDPNWFSTKCPYGAVGDVLWVRETWAEYYDPHGHPHVPFIAYRAGYDDENASEIKWKPSIHMPHAAARLFLKITDIRVERLQDISEADAVAEGAEGLLCTFLSNPYKGYTSWIEGFKKIWQKINGADSWEVNPWVWVVQFERIEKPSM